MQVADHAPGAVETLAGLEHRRDEAIPRRGGVVGGQALEQGAIVENQLADGGRDVFGADVGEAGQAGEIEQRVWGGHIYVSDVRRVGGR